MSLLEALLLTVPAVLLAPVLALAVVGLVGTVGPLAGAGAIADPVLTPFAILATLILPEAWQVTVAAVLAALVGALIGD